MTISINTNIPALLAAHHLSTNQSDLTQAMTRLASGKRINSAADDPGSPRTESDKIDGFLVTL